MTTAAPSPVILRLVRRAGRLMRSTEGVAAVEFAYLAPVLLLMLFGSIEVSRAISIDRRFGGATAMIGDLVAREKTIDEDDLAAMMDAAKQAMKPYDTNSLQIGVIAVKASSVDPNDTRVEWSYAHNGKSIPSQCESYTLPAGVIGKGGSVIVVETRYQFQPILANFDIAGAKWTGSTAMNWTDISIHSPRHSCVDHNGTNCILNCP